MMKLRRLLALFLLLVVVLPALVAHANTISDKQKELDAIKQQMKAAEQKAAQVNQQQKSVITELNKLEKDIDRTSSDLRTIETRLRNTENELQMLNRELADTEARLEERNNQLGHRLRALYERGPISYLEVMFNATTFADFVNRFLLLKTVVNQDVIIYHSVQEEKALVAESKASAEAKQQEITSLRKQTAIQKSNLEKRSASRTQVLTQLNQDKAQAQKAYNELNALAQEVDKIIKDLQAKNSTGQGTGTFTWPTPGFTKITSAFGWRTHPIFRTQEFHSGIDIGGSGIVNRNIVAADSGTIILADFLGGYGKTVIIDHGKGMSTLYAHSNTLLVKEGDKVVKGQAVARVGSTGNSTGPHLHFEVRKNGDRVSPITYVKP
ncbi:MAG: peptidase M23 [Bacillota bacterium]|nr:MAG: peptidase M23 [Bacillota bacterium]MBS3950561.1 peptidoglycan DD-metalloendopeptidase family protein [Peptococcaceae bacterium]